MQRAIDQGALGFLHGTATTPTIIRSIEGLLELYRLRFAVARRGRWVIAFRERLRTKPIQVRSETMSWTIRDNRVICRQTLAAIEGSMHAFRAQADDLTVVATKRMWDK